MHRYILLIFEQKGKLKFNEKFITKNERTGRPTLSIKSFAKKYKLGNPIAGNMYRAQFDDYVPILDMQLDGKK